MASAERSRSPKMTLSARDCARMTSPFRINFLAAMTAPIGRSANFPAKLEQGKWYTLVVETVGDEMRVTIDGQPAGYLKSSGIAHATKSKIELGVAGTDGSFDDIKVWNAAPAK